MLPNGDRSQRTPPRMTATLTQPPPRASVLASGTIACASSTDSSASASAASEPPLALPLPPNLVKHSVWNQGI